MAAQRRPHETSKPGMQAALIALRAEVADLLGNQDESSQLKTYSPDSSAMVQGVATAPNFGRRDADAEVPGRDLLLSEDEAVCCPPGNTLADAVCRREGAGAWRAPPAGQQRCWPPSRPSSSAHAPTQPTFDEFDDLGFCEATAAISAALRIGSAVPRTSDIGPNRRVSFGDVDISFSQDFVGKEADFAWHAPDSRRPSLADGSLVSSLSTSLESSGISMDSRRASLERWRGSGEVLSDVVIATPFAATPSSFADVPAGVDIQACTDHLEKIKMRCNQLMQKAHDSAAPSPKKRNSMGGA